MQKFVLIDISTKTNAVPNENIDKSVKIESSEKAALIFMSRAFAGQQNNVSANIRIQNSNTGILQMFSVKRKPTSSGFKHYINNKFT